MTRPSTAAPILAVLAIALVTLGAYVGGAPPHGPRPVQPLVYRAVG